MRTRYTPHPNPTESAFFLDSVLCWVALVVQSQHSQNKWTAPPSLLFHLPPHPVLLLSLSFCPSCPPHSLNKRKNSDKFYGNEGLADDWFTQNYSWAVVVYILAETHHLCGQRQNSWCLMLLKSCVIFCQLLLCLVLLPLRARRPIFVRKNIADFWEHIAILTFSLSHC